MLIRRGFLRVPTLGSILLLLACATCVIAAEAGWVDLFNGKDLTGWVQRGGKANYTVEDGMIVGSSVLNTDNSFLCTQKEYSDFILELDFKVDQGSIPGCRSAANVLRRLKLGRWTARKSKFSPAECMVTKWR